MKFGERKFFWRRRVEAEFGGVWNSRGGRQRAEYRPD